MLTFASVTEITLSHKIMKNSHEWRSQKMAQCQGRRSRHRYVEVPMNKETFYKQIRDGWM